MAYIYECDQCETIYKTGFTGKFQKEVYFGAKKYDVTVEIRKPHLCKKCLFKFMPLIIKDMKGAYNIGVQKTPKQ